MKQVFDAIYRDKVWGEGSGGGSQLSISRPYADLVSDFIRDHKLSRVIDLGCGDWLVGRMFRLGSATYHGIDAAEAVIAALAPHQTESIKFSCIDATSEPLPPGDLLLIRDVMQHWSNDAIAAFLPAMSAFKHVIVTNAVREFQTTNLDIATGDFRHIDLRLPPFSLDAEVLMRAPFPQDHISMSLLIRRVGE